MSQIANRRRAISPCVIRRRTGKSKGGAVPIFLFRRFPSFCAVAHKRIGTPSGPETLFNTALRPLSIGQLTFELHICAQLPDLGLTRGVKLLYKTSMDVPVFSVSPDPTCMYQTPGLKDA